MRTLQPIETTSVHNAVQQRIRHHIAASGLQPGDQLPTEIELADQLGVSRTMVREALRSLEALGVVHLRRGEGRYVGEFNLEPILQGMSFGLLSDLDSVREILDVRETLEAQFIERAMQSMDANRLERLRGLIEDMQRKSLAGETFPREDLLFHRTVFEATGNRLLVRLLDLFWQVYQELHDRAVLLRIESPDPDVRNHAAILAAIEAGDVNAARQRVMDHFTGIRGRLSASNREPSALTAQHAAVAERSAVPEPVKPSARVSSQA